MSLTWCVIEGGILTVNDIMIVSVNVTVNDVMIECECDCK